MEPSLPASGRAVPGEPSPPAPAPELALPGEPSRAVRLLVRVLLPGVLIAGGVVLVIMGHGRYSSVFASRDSFYSAVGVALLVTAIGVWLLSWLLRMNSQDAGDREREQSAREYFARHGHWPAEDDGDPAGSAT